MLLEWILISDLNRHWRRVDRPGCQVSAPAECTVCIAHNGLDFLSDWLPCMYLAGVESQAKKMNFFWLPELEGKTLEEEVFVLPLFSVVGKVRPTQRPILRQAIIRPLSSIMQKSKKKDSNYWEINEKRGLFVCVLEF